MNTELMEFLHRNHASTGIVARLETSGMETLADAWDKTSPKDLVWMVTRHGVMSPEQRRQFLVMVLESIEDKLTDPMSKNILDKLRKKSPITAWDADAAAYVAADAYAADVRAADAEAADAASWAAKAEDLWKVEEATFAAADATFAAAKAAARAQAAAAADAAEEEAMAAALSAAEVAAEAQARWIRTSFRLAPLYTN